MVLALLDPRSSKTRWRSRRPLVITFFVLNVMGLTLSART
jgi:hypothetical protein